MKRFSDGLLFGCGIVAILATAFLIARAGDVLTVEKDGVPKFVVSDAGKITVGATESYVNLVVQNNGAAPTNKVDITADVLTVEGIRLENVNVSADISAAVGAGGRDTNFADAADTWYYVWAITNNDGTLVNGVLTLAPATPNPPTNPVMPSGYTKKRRVGAVRNDSSGNFLLFVQEGPHVQYVSAIVTCRIVTAGTATIWTTKSAANFIPPTSRRGLFGLNSQVNHSVGGIDFWIGMRKTGSGVTYGEMWVANASVANIESHASTIGACSVDALQRIDYYLDAVPNNGGGAYIEVCGYYDRI